MSNYANKEYIIKVGDNPDITGGYPLKEKPTELIRCKDCKHRYVDGENVRYNVCELDHNKVQADDWFCADGEKRSD